MHQKDAKKVFLVPVGLQTACCSMFRFFHWSFATIIHTTVQQRHILWGYSSIFWCFGSSSYIFIQATWSRMSGSSSALLINLSQSQYLVQGLVREKPVDNGNLFYLTTRLLHELRVRLISVGESLCVFFFFVILIVVRKPSVDNDPAIPSFIWFSMQCRLSKSLGKCATHGGKQQKCFKSLC